MTPNPSDIPPLLTITNPVTYLKSWWKKVMSNEGVDLRLKIKPLTAIGIASLIAVSGFSLGRIGNFANTQVAKYIPQLAVTPTPSPNPWVNGAYLGVLQRGSNGNLYLITKSAEALLLDYPQNSKLPQYIGKKILASGKFNTQTKVLFVEDATALEIILQTQPVPTSSPSPMPLQTPTPEIIPSM
ncbi:MAG: hypothetical protein HY044_02800 [Candidatus Woesebacteria bacterium]|nr:MAG: hypothetical protein HY044_02800 [Candidatus Woesebacteria bacterium]